MIIGSDIYYHL